MDHSEARTLVERLRRHGRKSYASEAGITLRDRPMPLFQLLVLCMLASKPIDASVAVQAAKELFRAGLRTPRAVLGAERLSIIAAFGRAHYVRYDESSATRLVAMATRVEQDYRGDLRELARQTKPNPRAAKQLLKQFSGIGDAGADIFLREVQDVWPWVKPYFDRRALETAGDLGLPRDADKLAAFDGPAIAPLAVGLVRYSLDDDDVRDDVTG